MRYTRNALLRTPSQSHQHNTFTFKYTGTEKERERAVGYLLLPELLNLASDELLFLLVLVVAPPRAAQEHRRAVKPHPVLLRLRLRGGGLSPPATTIAVFISPSRRGIFAVPARGAPGRGGRGYSAGRCVYVVIVGSSAFGPAALAVPEEDVLDLLREVRTRGTTGKVVCACVSGGGGDYDPQMATCMPIQISIDINSYLSGERRGGS